MPTLDNRKTIVRLIREWGADIVICHRPNDYHPDHRYTAMLIQDAAYMVTVPFFCPDTPYLQRNPVFLYYQDGFKKPNPFVADIAVAIDDVFEKKMEAVLALASQTLEGGCEGHEQMYPPDDSEKQAAREQQVRRIFERYFASCANQAREQLVNWYGPGEAARTKYAEAFEICEYGRQPTEQEIRRLFPFFPNP
jgi:LmbE family N-acetylglucosaminyl deacetylase